MTKSVPWVLKLPFTLILIFQRKQKIAKQKAKNDKIREEKERKKKEKEELLKQKEEEENKKVDTNSFLLLEYYFVENVFVSIERMAVSLCQKLLLGLTFYIYFGWENCIFYQGKIREFWKVMYANYDFFWY